MADPDAAAAQQRRGKTPRTRRSYAGDGGARDQVNIYPASLTTAPRAETLTQPHGASQRRILLSPDALCAHARACAFCGTDGGFKGGEGGSDRILAAGFQLTQHPAAGI